MAKRELKKESIVGSIVKSPIDTSTYADVHAHTDTPTPRRAVFQGEKRTARMNLLLQPSILNWFKEYCWSHGYSLNTAAQEAFILWVESKGGEPYSK